MREKLVYFCFVEIFEREREISCYKMIIQISFLKDKNGEVIQEFVTLIHNSIQIMYIFLSHPLRLCNGA